MASIHPRPITSTCTRMQVVERSESVPARPPTASWSSSLTRIAHMQQQQQARHCVAFSYSSVTAPPICRQPLGAPIVSPATAARCLATYAEYAIAKQRRPVRSSRRATVPVNHITAPMHCSCLFFLHRRHSSLRAPKLPTAVDKKFSNEVVRGVPLQFYYAH